MLLEKPNLSAFRRMFYNKHNHCPTNSNIHAGMQYSSLEALTKQLFIVSSGLQSVTEDIPA